MKRLTHKADFGFEDWEETLFFVRSDPNGSYDILDIAKYQGTPEFDEILKNISLRLASIENILGDEYELERLRELVEADRDGRCVVLPCKQDDVLWTFHTYPSERIYSFHVTDLSTLNGRTMLNTDIMGVVDARDVGKAVFLTREDAEAAIKGEKNGRI